MECYVMGGKNNPLSYECNSYILFGNRLKKSPPQKQAKREDFSNVIIISAKITSNLPIKQLTVVVTRYLSFCMSYNTVYYCLFIQSEHIQTLKIK